MVELNKVHLKRTKRVLAGHLWVFSNEIYESPKVYVPGSIVELFDRTDAFLGIGYINPASLISVRILSRERVTIDREFIKKRLRAALDLRARLFGDQEAVRLVYSEGDYLPGLVVDRYGGCAVLQFLTQGIENLRDVIIELIDEMLNPRVIVLKNESRSRTLEGLSLYREVVKGSLDALPLVREDGLLFEVDPLGGQKTGFFLDQKENRRSLKRYVGGGRGLDLFCYTGAWTMHLASSGVEMKGVDQSERAVRQAIKNAELNSLQGRAVFIEEDVFSFLRREVSEGEKKYDCVVLDPPAFVKSAAKLKEAVRAYRELNGHCMRLVRPGGVLASSSCSYHLDRETFLDMLRAAAKDAGRDARLLSLRSQDADHPVLLAMPETEYLKCAFLLVD
ncbi:MAG: class I SAM-dependent rRNA methyltransferase [Nitrospiraceae bacterium]|nr:class I SAM-dependent rRNA methyltransferase [Nitrospiraceae bacterium]